jgi:hypothetical protein
LGDLVVLAGEDAAAPFQNGVATLNTLAVAANRNLLADSLLLDLTAELVRRRSDGCQCACSRVNATDV